MGSNLVGDLYADDDSCCQGFHHTAAALDAAEKILAREPKFNLIEHLRRQHEFSLGAFGPGFRIKGICDHLRKEVTEIESAENPAEILGELTDILILAFDAQLRIATPEQIVAALVAKQTQNEAREWPDWRNCDPDKAIEHVRVINVNRDFNG